MITCCRDPHGTVSAVFLSTISLCGEVWSRESVVWLGPTGTDPFGSSSGCDPDSERACAGMSLWCGPAATAALICASRLKIACGLFGSISEHITWLYPLIGGGPIQCTSAPDSRHERAIASAAVLFPLLGVPEINTFDWHLCDPSQLSCGVRSRAAQAQLLGR